MTEKKQISLNAMPPKFNGESLKDSTIPDTDIWIDQFRNACFINSWTDAESVLILGSWLEGDALRWHFNEKKKEETRMWSLDLWLEKLLESFPNVLTSQGSEYTVFGLACLHPQVDESIMQFHVRFNSYLKKIEKVMYTEGLIRDCYLKTLRTHREQIWMLIATNSTLVTLDQIMREALCLDKVFQVHKILRQN